MNSLPQETGGRHIAGIFTSSETLLDADGGTKQRNTIHLRIYKSILKSGMLAELKGAPLSVLLAIALYADAEGKAWPSVSTLQRDTGYGSKNTIKKALSKLEDLGWIKRRQQRQEDGTWGRRIFTIKHPKVPRDGGSDRGPKNGRPLNGRPLNDPEVLSSNSEEVTKGEGGGRGGASSDPPSPAEKETAAALDEKEKQKSPPPQLQKFIKQIKPHLTMNGEPTDGHLETLSRLHTEHDEKLGEIITYAFAEHFPRDSWMKNRPLAWGTVMNCLPDAAAAWEELTPVFAWTCPDCGEENAGPETQLNGRRGLLCERCGTGVATAQGRQVAMAADYLDALVYNPKEENR